MQIEVQRGFKSLSKDVVKQRVDKEVALLEDKYVNYISSVEANWNGDNLMGETKAFGFKGKVLCQVLDNEIAIKIEFPMVLRPVSWKIEDMVKFRADRICRS